MSKMNIQGILASKKEQLLAKGDPLGVIFTVDEINILADQNQLLSLKLSVSFPRDYEACRDLTDCTNKIINGSQSEDEDLYRVLEFCMQRNRVLEHPITEVFSNMKVKR